MPGIPFGRHPLDEQASALRATPARNELLADDLARVAKLNLPGWS
jgi:hypothetical protein